MTIGTDVVEHKRFTEAINRNNGRLKKRLFSETELAWCRSDLDLAVVFSAKESISKALGTGFDNKLSWHDIEVSFLNNVLKAGLSGQAKELASGRILQITSTRGKHRTITCALLSERS